MQHAVVWPRRLYWGARARIEAAKAAARVRSVQRSITAGHALDGKIAVITGAGAGIGRALATCFARAGAHCVIVEVNPDEGNVALAQLAAEGLSADLIVADVSDEKQVRDAAAHIAERFAAVDVLVNNAGICISEDRQTRASCLPDDMLEKTLAVNLYGVVHITKALVHLLPRGGRIINVSSVMGRSTHRYDGLTPAYRISKAALNSYTRSLAAELQVDGIMVDCFHPGWVRTALGGAQAKILPHEATHTAFYLATRRFSTLTGLFWQDCRAILW